LAEWKPQEAGLRDAQIKLAKDYARAVLDWELVDQAVDQEISDQRVLAAWWREAQGVRPLRTLRVRSVGAD
jgi:hypothetical protein